MNKSVITAFAVLMTAVFASNGSFADTRTRIDPLVYTAEDGERINGFTYISRETTEDAPLAVLMHPMAASSLYWLAKDNLMSGDKITSDLIRRGYRVVALDARAHGARLGNKNPVEFLEAVQRGETNAYKAMISSTIKDYQLMLDDLLKKHPNAKGVLAAGYSMGAQMATLLAAQDDRVTHLVTMVPPAVDSVPELAPIKFAPEISVPWLLITADRDQFSTKEQNAALANSAGRAPETKSFDSKHLLPSEYVETIYQWLDSLAE